MLSSSNSSSTNLSGKHHHRRNSSITKISLGKGGNSSSSSLAADARFYKSQHGKGILAFGSVITCLLIASVYFLIDNSDRSLARRFQVETPLMNFPEDAKVISSFDLFRTAAVNSSDNAVDGYSFKSSRSGLIVLNSKTVRVYIPDMLYREAENRSLQFPLSIDFLWGDDLPVTPGIQVPKRSAFIQAPIDHYFKSTKILALPSWRSDLISRQNLCVRVSLSRCKDCRVYPRCENRLSANPEQSLMTLVTSISNLNELANLPEWINYHKAVGIEQFIVYNLMTESLEELSKLSYPIVRDGVIIVDWTSESSHSNSVWKSDVIARFEKQLEWFGILSVDDYIVLGSPEKKIAQYFEFGKENRKRNIGQLVLPIYVHGPAQQFSKPSSSRSVFEQYPKTTENFVYNLVNLFSNDTQTDNFIGTVLSNLNLISNKEICSAKPCFTDKDPKATFASLRVGPDKMTVHRFLRSFEEWAARTSSSSSVRPIDYFYSTRAF